MSPTTDDDAADELRDAVASLRRLANGENLAEVYPLFVPHNVIMALCLDRGTVAHAWLTANPADDGEAITAEWMDAVGGDDERGDGDRVWPIGPAAWLSVGLGGGVWHCWVRSWVREGGGGGEESVTLPLLTTRGQLRRLLAALGVPAAEGGVS